MFEENDVKNKCETGSLFQFQLQVTHVGGDITIFVFNHQTLRPQPMMSFPCGHLVLFSFLHYGLSCPWHSHCSHFDTWSSLVDHSITFLTRHLVLLSPSYPLSLLDTSEGSSSEHSTVLLENVQRPRCLQQGCILLWSWFVTIQASREIKTVSWPSATVGDLLQAPVRGTALTVTQSATQIDLAICRPQNSSGNKLSLPSLGLIPFCAVLSCKW